MLVVFGVLGSLCDNNYNCTVVVDEGAASNKKYNEIDQHNGVKYQT